MWVTIILWVKPYGSFWDNTLSATLNFQLLIIIISGMALEIYRLTPEEEKDEKTSAGMGIFMVLISIVVTASGFVVIFISVPCIRDLVTAKLCGWVDGEMIEEEGDEMNEDDKDTSELHKTIEVTIPNGTKPGNTINVNLPDGREIHITVPHGMHAGNVMTINYDDHGKHHVKTANKTGKNAYTLPEKSPANQVEIVVSRPVEIEMTTTSNPAKKNK